MRLLAPNLSQWMEGAGFELRTSITCLLPPPGGPEALCLSEGPCLLKGSPACSSKGQTPLTVLPPLTQLFIPLQSSHYGLLPCRCSGLSLSEMKSNPLYHECVSHMKAGITAQFVSLWSSPAGDLHPCFSSLPNSTGKSAGRLPPLLCTRPHIHVHTHTHTHTHPTCTCKHTLLTQHRYILPHTHTPHTTHKHTTHLHLYTSEIHRPHTLHTYPSSHTHI